MFEALTTLIKAAMQAALPPSPEPLIADYYARMEYHLGWRGSNLEPNQAEAGKLVRPVLAVLACEALGGKVEHALPLAAGLQLLHDFSLVHDDIEDHSAQRRGRATVWSLWGLEIGINVGDGMFAVAHRSLYRMVDAGVEPATALLILQGFEETIMRICEGQHLDISGEGRFDVTTERYLAMIKRKTAALLAAATGLGARLATNDAGQVEAMTRFGEALGMAFQVQDDLLDIWGEPTLTGKPRAVDLVQRKLSLPVIHALEHAMASDRVTFEHIYRQASVEADDLPILLAILLRTASEQAVAALADGYHREAEQALAMIKPVNDAAFQQLQQFTATLLGRQR
ncbi:MAG: polyprenyl synthetase family protein [Herpetosiphonaceae bacterium]|nr:polyprenyl synthetase family protein [Herpetosiphonaceae bacterium]